MVASYSAVREQVTLDDIGFRQAVQLYEYFSHSSDTAPAVIDTELFLKQPREQMEALCAALQVPFDESMLHWPKGSRANDGVWAPYWYDSVNASTGFAPYRSKTPHLDEAQQQLVAEARPYYETLKQLAIQ